MNSTVNSLHQLIARGERPFPACPQVARYFPASAIEDARRRIARAIERGDGPGIVIGATGTGKSLLLQVLAAQYHGRFDVVLLACAKICTRRALLQTILFELGLPYRSRDEGELRLSLLDQFLSGEPGTVGLLLLVDEAQSLSLALLDELRVLTNVVRGGTPRVRLVLAGSSTLEESFANPELESFSQRLAARTYLSSFSRQETSQFVRAQIAASGGAPDQIVTADALEAIFDATDGAPRLVNQLCDRALLMAEENRCSQIDSQIVQSAWSDLQQLPTSWAAPNSDAISIRTTSPAIEFGSLEALMPCDDDGLATALADSDSTELDFDEECDDFIPRKQAPTEAARIKNESNDRQLSGSNPFAEEFDEEELVLDNFAGWDEVIRDRTPRVENRRDSGFASRVRDAMMAVDSTCSVARTEPEIATTREVHTEAGQIANEKPADVDQPFDDRAPNWPPIRLAVVADSPRLTPIPLITPPGGVAIAGAAAFDPVLPENEEMPAAELSPIVPWEQADRAAPNVNASATSCAASAATWQRDRLNFVRCTPDEDPVLIVEDDPNEPVRYRSSVRRENYRNLFSRLRSG